MSDIALCPCGNLVAAVPGYETRTIYCSRQCEDRAYRKRQRDRLTAYNSFVQAYDDWTNDRSIAGAFARLEAARAALGDVQ